MANRIDLPTPYACLFDLMEEWQNEHPDATDDEAFEAVCCHVIPDRYAAAFDQHKEDRRERFIDNA